MYKPCEMMDLAIMLCVLVKVLCDFYLDGGTI
jgi:hypothetical protein